MSTAFADPRICLRPELAGVRMSPEEFDAIDECTAGYRYELINGVLVVSPPPLEGERGPNDFLGYLLLAYRYQHAQGAALDGTLPEQTIVTHETRRRTDRVIWAGLGRVPDPAGDTPTIAIEFVSEAKRDWQRDYVDKKREYMDVGIAEYWIIDRFRRRMTVVSNRPTGLEERVVEETEVYTTPLLPGFELPLGQVLAVADRWQRG